MHTDARQLAFPLHVALDRIRMAQQSVNGLTNIVTNAGVRELLIPRQAELPHLRRLAGRERPLAV